MSENFCEGMENIQQVHEDSFGPQFATSLAVELKSRRMSNTVGMQADLKSNTDASRTIF